MEEERAKGIGARLKVSQGSGDRLKRKEKWVKGIGARQKVNQGSGRY